MPATILLIHRAHGRIETPHVQHSSAGLRLWIPPRGCHVRSFSACSLLQARVANPAHALGTFHRPSLGVHARNYRRLQLVATGAGQPAEPVHGNADDPLGGGGSFRVCLLQECSFDRVFSGIWPGLLSFTQKHQPAGVCVSGVPAGRTNQAAVAWVTAGHRGDSLLHRAYIPGLSLGHARSARGHHCIAQCDCADCISVRADRIRFRSARPDCRMVAGALEQWNPGLHGECSRQPGRDFALHPALFSLPAATRVVCLQRHSRGDPVVEGAQAARDIRGSFPFLRRLRCLWPG